MLCISFMRSPTPQNDPENHKVDDRDLRAGRGEEDDLLDEEVARRVRRSDDVEDDDLDQAALSGDDLAELDEDDLKDMEGPDA